MLIVCNIGHESALETGDPIHYTPPRIIQQMRSALWSLPLWATPKWVDDSSSWWVHPFSEHLSPYLTDRERCHIVRLFKTSTDSQDFSYSCLDHLCNSSITEEGGLDIMLWGHERSLAHQLTKLYGLNEVNEEISELPRALIPCWTREASVSFFRDYSTVPWRNRIQMISQIEDLSDLLFSASGSSLLLKLPYSSSGRGVWRIDHIDRKEVETLHALLRKHHSLLVEPFLDKVQDYGAEYYINKEGEVSFLGLCAFETDGQGRYLESFCQDPDKTLQQLAATLSNPNELAQTLAQHKAFLSREIAPYYHGPVGIDLLTFRTNSRGVCRDAYSYDISQPSISLHPWVEINLRYTMGHYALDLYRERIPRTNTDDYRFGILSAQRAKTFRDSSRPPMLDANGRLLSGLLPLTSTTLSAVSHVAYLRHIAPQS